MDWNVETLNTKVDEELESLEPTLLTKFLHISEMLETYGPHKVREPYVKPLGNKLWEIRMKGKSGIARAIYVTVKERRIVVLHVFVKKTDKTPRSAINLALNRLKEMGT
ncbi:MAG TPA: type II toxin-antitoxin system RelE/ParE family toxin [Nitrospinaceae bacterium]|nr:type II toxin-antitoxin system RelE/ParE family toxin [Nitrospinaceae bacterium]